jgi:hypothetical protein
LPGPHWAVWQALPPAGSSWACRPANRATDLIRAFGRVAPNHGVARASRPVGPVLHFAHWPGH